MWLYVTIIIINSVELYMFIPVLQSGLCNHYNKLCWALHVYTSFAVCAYFHSYRYGRGTGKTRDIFLSVSWLIVNFLLFTVVSNATVSFQGALSATALEECVCVSWCGHACSRCWSLCPSLHQHHAGRSCNAVICPEWKEAGFWIPSLSCRCVHSWKCICLMFHM